MDGKTTFSGRITGIVIMFLGLSSIAAGIAMLFVASDRLMAYIFIGLPCLSLGCIELLSGYATYIPHPLHHQAECFLALLRIYEYFRC